MAMTTVDDGGLFKHDNSTGRDMSVKIIDLGGDILSIKIWNGDKLNSMYLELDDIKQIKDYLNAQFK